MQIRRLIGYGFIMTGLALVGYLFPSLVCADDVKETKKAVATVNGVPIFEEALDAHLAAVVKKGKASGMARDPRKLDDRQKRKGLESLIDAELLRQASQQHPVGDYEAKVSKKLQEIKDKFPDEEAFLKSLQVRGKTLDAFMAELRAGVRYDEYLANSKITGIAMPDQELEKFYRDNQKSFLIPEQIKVRHILVTFDNKSGEQIENAYKQSCAVREQLVSKKDFDAVAREVASCSSEGNCGVVDYFTRGKMPAEFEAAAFSLKPGEVSSPVKTPYGYHVIEILDRKPEAVRQFSEVRDFIERYLRRFLETEKLTAHVVDLKKKADIKVFFP